MAQLRVHIRGCTTRQALGNVIVRLVNYSQEDHRRVKSENNGHTGRKLKFSDISV